MAQEQQSAIKVRKITDLHANYSDQGEGTNGKFSFQLVLDNGAEEAVIRPPADDCKVILKHFRSGESVYFDTERRTVVFSDL